MEGKEGDMHCYDWFFCTKKLDKNTIMEKILKKE
jgi:peroxiredoxin (alkyl hydroperoxide reductase subunit C)